jgi:hypothetical protein
VRRLLDGDGADRADFVVISARVGLAAAASAVALVVVAPVCAAKPDRLEGPFGSGAAQVWIVVPPGAIHHVVVFGHGWKQHPPSSSYPWANQFRPWLDHLASNGAAVIFPRYQLGVGDVFGPGLVDSFRSGLREGFARIRYRGQPVAAIGYSVGASLVFSYAANARAWRLPVPAAVDAVFPAGIIPGSRLPELPAAIRVLIQVGDRDTEAGSGGANAFWAWLRGHPASRKSYETVVSHGGFVATHAAPKETSAAARNAFWKPLDELISRLAGA